MEGETFCNKTSFTKNASNILIIFSGNKEVCGSDEDLLLLLFFKQTFLLNRKITLPSIMQLQ